MDLSAIRTAWQGGKGDRKASAELWDSLSPRYRLDALPDEGQDSLLKLIAGKGLLPKGGRALDVGCGGGRYTLALARKGYAVTGLDFAPQMIAAAKENAQRLDVSAARFLQADWEGLDLREADMEKAFDLVFAHMTPAVQSAAGFEKLMAASRGACILTKLTRRSHAVQDGVFAQLGMRPFGNDDTIAYAFDLLWTLGYQPRIAYEARQWRGRVPVEQMHQEICRRAAVTRALNPGEQDAVLRYLQGLAQDGMIEENSRATAVTLYWRVDE